MVSPPERNRSLQLGLAWAADRALYPSTHRLPIHSVIVNGMSPLWPVHVMRSLISGLLEVQSEALRLP